MTTHRTSINYYPPSDEAVERFVREASERLAEQYQDESYLDPEVMWGLSAFIKLIADIKARQLNAENEAEAECFDSLEKSDYP